MRVLFVISCLLAAGSTVFASSCLKVHNTGSWTKVSAPRLSEVPSKSVIGGYESDKHTNLYICRAEGSFGKYYHTNRLCYVQRKNANEVNYKDFDLLANVDHIVWSPVQDHKLPCNTLKSEGNSVSYAGRNYYQDFLIPGDIVDGVLYLPYGTTFNHHYDTFYALTIVPQRLTIASSKVSELYEVPSQYLTFMVESRDEVYIDFGVDSDMVYTLYLGTLNNKISGIGPIGNPMDSNEITRHILDLTTFTGFWVRWNSENTMQFGNNGNMVPLINYTDNMVSQINSVRFRSSSSESLWQIPDLPQWNGHKFVNV